GIHTFIATSDIHLKHKLRMNREQVVEAAVKAVSLAKKFTDYVVFSEEDASRSDLQFLFQVFREVIRAGAKVINVPDTTGYAIPSEFGALLANLIERTAGGDRVIWSAHCHNDLGLAVANSLAAVHNGARQIECTINGIGERADKKKNVYDEDIEAIVAEEILRVPGRPDKFELLYMNVNSSSDGIPSATVKLRVDGGEITDHASGDGVVDACYKVITKITGSQS